MKIVLDLQATQSESRIRGIGRYSLSLALGMLRNQGDHEWYVCLNHALPEALEPLQQELRRYLPRDNILLYRTLPNAWSRDPANFWRDRAGQLIRESFLASLSADVVHTFSMFEGWGDSAVLSAGLLSGNAIQSATIHDLIPYADQETYLPSPDHRAWYLNQLESLRRCDVLLSNSEYTRRSAIDLLGYPEESIVSVSAAAASQFRPLDAHSPEHRRRLEELGVNDHFIMYTGVIGREEPRKNFMGLLRAYATLPEALRDKYQLVLVGKYNSYSHHDMVVEAARLGIRPEQLLCTNRVEDADLALLYSACDLFVFPSIEEGFGLPALEAMRCGAVVIGANTSSVPEVIGNPEALFDPHSTESIARAMEHALVDETLRQSLLDYSARHLAGFDWDLSARRAIAVFEDVHAKKCASAAGVVANIVAGKSDSELIEPRLAAALVELGGDHLAQQDLVYCAQAIAENTPRLAPRKLFLDISVLIEEDELTGIQRVSRSLLQQFTSRPMPGFEVELLYIDEAQQFRVIGYVPGDTSTMVRCEDDQLADFSSRDVYLGLDLHYPGQFMEYRNQTLAYHRQRGMTVYYLVHDLLPLLQPDHFVKPIQDIYPRWLASIAGRSDGIICVSRTVMEELHEWLEGNQPERLGPLKLAYVHHGADIESSLPSRGLPPEADRILSSLEQRPTLLMVGTIEPRKGQQQALAALELLWDQGLEINLVIIGKSGWNMAAFEKRLNQHPRRDRQLFWLHGISDEMLERVYAASSLLLAASSGEGFGLPLIEAAQHELPILARDIPVFREVAGEHATYFSGTEPAALADAIKAWLQHQQEGTAAASAGMAWQTWQASAARYADLLQDKCDWTTSWEPSPVFHDGQVAEQ